MYGKITLSSVLDSELLASSLNQHLQRQTVGQSPEYVKDTAFQQFIDDVQPMINTNRGLMFITLDKDYYMPGETVKGSVFFELFHFSLQTVLKIRFEGSEIMPKRVQKKIFELKEIEEEDEVSSQGYIRNSGYNNNPNSDSNASLQHDIKNDPRIKKPVSSRFKLPELKLPLWKKKTKETVPLSKESLGHQKPAKNSQLGAALPRNSSLNNHHYDKRSSINSNSSSEYGGHQFQAQKIRRMLDNQRELDNGQVQNFNADGDAGSGNVDDDEDDQEDEGICLFKIEKRIFTFRGQCTPKGQYEFPFTYTLPDKKTIPSTFQFINDIGENFQIKYSVTAYFEDAEPILIYEKEIRVVQREPPPTVKKLMKKHKNGINCEYSKDKEINPYGPVENHKYNSKKPEQYTPSPFKDKQLEDDIVIEDYSQRPMNKPWFKAQSIQLNRNENQKEEEEGLPSFIDQTSLNQQSIYMRNQVCLLCHTRPMFADIRLSKPVFEPNEPLEININFGPYFRNIHTIKATLIVQVQIKDLLNSSKILEQFEHDVLPATKVRPFLQRESLVIDLENYKEIVDKAKEDFNLEMQLGEHPLIKNEVGIKTLDQKRVIIDGMEMQKRPSRPGQMLFKGPQNKFFTQQALSCLDISTCDGTVIKSRFFIEVQLEAAQLLWGKKEYKVRFPVKFYMRPRDSSSIKGYNPTKNDKNAQMRYKFPKQFDPTQMPGSHYQVDGN